MGRAFGHLSVPELGFVWTWRPDLISQVHDQANQEPNTQNLHAILFLVVAKKSQQNDQRTRFS